MASSRATFFPTRATGFRGTQAVWLAPLPHRKPCSSEPTTEGIPPSSRSPTTREPGRRRVHTQPGRTVCDPRSPKRVRAGGTAVAYFLRFDLLARRSLAGNSPPPLQRGRLFTSLRSTFWGDAWTWMLYSNSKRSQPLNIWLSHPDPSSSKLARIRGLNRVSQCCLRVLHAKSSTSGGAAYEPFSHWVQ